MISDFGGTISEKRVGDLLSLRQRAMKPQWFCSFGELGRRIRVSTKEKNNALCKINIGDRGW